MTYLIFELWSGIVSPFEYARFVNDYRQGLD
jgi:hypothetical protein